jgi:hypothetical protein
MRTIVSAEGPIWISQSFYTLRGFQELHYLPVRTAVAKTNHCEVTALQDSVHKVATFPSHRFITGAPDSFGFPRFGWVLVAPYLKGFSLCGWRLQGPDQPARSSTSVNVPREVTELILA